MTTFDWVRHGQTQANVDQVFQGQLDTAATHLTVRGLQQAEQLAQTLRSVNYDRVVSSPLHRARQTTAALTQVVPVVPEFDERLQEADYGQWTGQTYAAVSAEYAASFDPVTREVLPDELATVGGESYLMVQRRVGQWLAEQVVDHPDDHVLVVSHGLTIKALALLTLGAPATAALPEPSNTSVTRMTIDPVTGRRYLRFYNVGTGNFN
ncbi:histidine phosphatase family protein [Levilactobacillus lindianensis]|uniref:histidine phosphatase family protein n=1 Tax=Levilactobacillus lindianensis TaxID=2486018 RepID=UPI000F748B6A|nr:histidine phosphatase family protein [Levilactobacillus lindianensis]